MEPYKRLLDWINLCVDQGNDIKFPEVSPPNHTSYCILAFLSLDGPVRLTIKHRSRARTMPSTSWSISSPLPTS